MFKNILYYNKYAYFTALYKEKGGKSAPWHLSYGKRKTS